MQIRATQRFRHSRQTYERGQAYEVPAEQGAYFIRAGWAVDPATTTSDGARVIRPDTARHANG